MKDTVAHLGIRLLKEDEQAKFRNERRKIADFVEMVMQKFPQATAEDGMLIEPFSSLVFLTAIGQRPITSVLILEILLDAGRTRLNGKEVGEKLAKKLEVPSHLTTEGGNYQDRVGDLLSTFVQIGLLESTAHEQDDDSKEGFRLKKSRIPEIEAFLKCILLKRNVLEGFLPQDLRELFERRFDKRLGDVIKSGTRKKQPFSVGKIMKSLLNPKLGISFETALRVIEEIEPKLKRGMRTREIQSILYNALKVHDEKAAESYRLSYPQILSITMSNGEMQTLNYRLVKTLIDKEVKLKLTRNLLDTIASTVYNVISRTPEKYQEETAIREYIHALVRAECVYVRSAGAFVKEHLRNAVSALEGCRNSLASDEVEPSRVLLGQFLEQVSLVAIVEFGYVPFKDFAQNVDLISNVLREEEIKQELQEAFQLDEAAVSRFQRIRFLTQQRRSASKKSLKKMVEECDTLIALCEEILSEVQLQPKLRPVAASITGIVPLKSVMTGFGDLDNLLLGGIPEGATVVLTSPSCDEEDLLIKRFLETGIEENQITLYITCDANATMDFAEQLPSNLYLVLCNPEADRMVQSASNVFKLKGVENLTDIDIALTTVFRILDEKSTRPKRACIEIISDALLQHHAASTRRWLTALIPKLKSNGFTTLAVMNPHMHPPQEVQAILDLFQGEIHIYKEKTEKGLRRFLRIEKMYNQEYIQAELLLKKEHLQKAASQN